MEEQLKLTVATVTVERVLTDDGLVDFVQAVDNDGERLPLTETLGMLRLAEDTFIRMAMGEDDQDDDA